MSLFYCIVTGTTIETILDFIEVKVISGSERYPLNTQVFTFRKDEGERIKEISTNCRRCKYPIVLRKYESKTKKYFIIEK
jgi:hypothetical protein